MADNVLMNYLISELANSKNIEKLDSSDNLIENGIIDSLGIMKLLMFLENTYSLKISDDELTMENFQSHNAILSLINRKIAGNGKST
jgi:acyl carrier protein